MQYFNTRFDYSNNNIVMIQPTVKTLLAYE
jgi:hypothetical protein